MVRKSPFRLLPIFAHNFKVIMWGHIMWGQVHFNNYQAIHNNFNDNNEPQSNSKVIRE